MDTTEGCSITFPGRRHERDKRDFRAGPAAKQQLGPEQIETPQIFILNNNKELNNRGIYILTSQQRCLNRGTFFNAGTYQGDDLSNSKKLGDV